MLRIMQYSQYLSEAWWYDSQWYFIQGCIFFGEGIQVLRPQRPFKLYKKMHKYRFSGFLSTQNLFRLPSSHFGNILPATRTNWKLKKNQIFNFNRLYIRKNPTVQPLNIKIWMWHRSSGSWLRCSCTAYHCSAIPRVVSLEQYWAVQSVRGAV